jgi:uncharacterized membrane protein YkvA (DUF1232 family)
MIVEKRQNRIKVWSTRLKNEIRTLCLAYRHPGTPIFVKVWIACIVAYAISPIDLIPDFIPVLGYLDDLIVLPLGIWLAIKMIPPDILAECRIRAREPVKITSPVKWIVIIVIAIFWIGIVLCVIELLRLLWFAS